MKAMLLAAGLGQRLKPITDKWAKPAVPFLNIPMIYYSWYRLSQIGVRDWIINLHSHPEQIQDLIAAITTSPMTVRFSPELQAPLGSGGALVHAKTQGFFLGHDKDASNCDDNNFWVANADEVFFLTTYSQQSSSTLKPLGPLESMWQKHISSKALATLLITEHSGVGTQFGGAWIEGARLNDARDEDINSSPHPENLSTYPIVEFGKNPKDKKIRDLFGFHYVGYMICNNRIFKYLPKTGESNLIYDALAPAIQEGEHVQGFYIPSGKLIWFETGNPKDFLKNSIWSLQEICSNPNGAIAQDFNLLQAFLKQFKVQESLSHVDPKRRCLVSTNCQTDYEKITIQDAIIGTNVDIIPHIAEIQNSVLLPGSKMSPQHVIRDSVIF